MFPFTAKYMRHNYMTFGGSCIDVHVVQFFWWDL